METGTGDIGVEVVSVDREGMLGANGWLFDLCAFLLLSSLRAGRYRSLILGLEDCKVGDVYLSCGQTICLVFIGV